MDYLNHWSLESNPFGRREASPFFVGTPQRETIARLHCLISGGLISGLLVAQSGCGMTTLLQHVSLSAGFGDTAVQMILTGGRPGDRDEVWAQIAGQLRIHVGSVKELETKVTESIRSLSRQGVSTIWLIDDCDEISASVARTLVQQDRHFSVVLGVTPSQAQVACLAIGQCPLRMDLTPLSLEDSIRFVQSSLRQAMRVVAARNESAVFSDAALVRLHELGEGRMGWIGRVAELALMIGAAHGIEQIDVDLLESVQAELVRAA